MFSLIDLALITCPKYWHFLFFIIGNDDLVVFAIFKTSWFYVPSMILLTYFYILATDEKVKNGHKS